jgi:hypothetical protein
MPSRGQSLTVEYSAVDTATNLGRTGDVANHTLRWVKDGTAAAPTNGASEVDATNCPGLYKVTLTAAECTCDFGTLAGKSGTANTAIIPTKVQFEQLPLALAGGRVDSSVGAMAANTLTAAALAADAVAEVQAGLATAAALGAVQADADDIQARLPAALVAGRLDCSVGAMAADVLTAAALAADAVAEVQAGLSTLTAAGVWAHTTRVLTAGTNITLAKGTGVTGFNDLDAPGVRTAVGLAAANLDTQLATIRADTDDLQTRLPAALVGGRMDSSVGFMAANTLTASALAADAVAEINAGGGGASPAAVADAVLARNLAGGSDGGRTVRDALRPNRNRWTRDPATGLITVYAEDDSAVAWTSATTSAAMDPIRSFDPP